MMDLPGGPAGSVRVKICGITTLDDAMAAIHSGADGLGFVFAPGKRRIDVSKAREIIRALPSLVTRVGVFVDTPPYKVKEAMEECGLDLAQLHGDESVEYCAELAGMVGRNRIVKALSPDVEVSAQHIFQWIQPYHPYCAAFLIDARLPGQMGGTGKVVDWELAARLREMLASIGRMLILAGGLNPDNVGTAVARVRPHAVDVSSGVEEPAGSGRKDPEKIRRFIGAARGPGAEPQGEEGVLLVARISRSLLLVP